MGLAVYVLWLIAAILIAEQLRDAGEGAFIAVLVLLLVPSAAAGAIVGNLAAAGPPLWIGVLLGFDAIEVQLELFDDAFGSSP